MTCEAEGEPDPQIVWLSQSEGRLRDRGRNYEIVANHTKLVFSGVEKDNEDHYRCRVSVLSISRLLLWQHFLPKENYYIASYFFIKLF